MSEMPASFVWLNGALVPTGLASIDPNDRGLTLGDGLFETIRCANGIPRFAKLHLVRLRRGAAKLDIALPFDDTEILAAFAQTLTANRLEGAAVLRLTFTRGAGLRGLTPPADAKPTLLITASPLAASPPEIAAVICRITRRNEFSPLAAIKSLNALDNILARNEAVKQGCEEAILLNTQGYVAEASAANIFVLTDGRWLTPRVADGALPGIFRSLVLVHQAASEARISEADLFSAQSICLGNALGVRAVTSLDGRDIEMQQEKIAALRTILHAEEV
jgi:branched-chain amino acid aminotransferase